MGPPDSEIPMRHLALQAPRAVRLESEKEVRGSKRVENSAA